MLSDAERAWKAKREREYNMGIKHTTSIDRARELITQWRSLGVSWAVMEERVGINRVSLRSIYRGRVGFLRTDTEKVILAAEGAFASADAYQYPAFMVARRLQAMQANGFAVPTIAVLLGRSKQQVHSTMTLKAGQKTFKAALALDVFAAYAKYAESDPRAHGQTEHGFKYALTMARKHGYVPSKCWDDDTIDDPKAHPEWTGECGSIFGYLIHLREESDPCPRCQVARDRTKVDVELMVKLLKARENRRTIAEILGTTRGLVDQYARAAVEPDPTIHRLSDVDRLELTAHCSICGEYVQIYAVRNGESFQCSNKVKEYRAQREKEGKDVRGNRKDRRAGRV